jgi:phosphopantothenoylcysteine decarboxylase/phosphopantothenate--cysteine ligase
MTPPAKGGGLSAGRYRGRRRLRILISAGPTREPLDPVRFISNYSTGTMGAHLAEEALRRGHDAIVVRGPTDTPFPARARMIAVERAAQMDAALRRILPRADALVMAAAVCDFRPAARGRRKLPRRAHTRLALSATPDILARLPHYRGQVRVGFALETDPGLSRMQRKLRQKRVDVLVGQWINGDSSPFGARSVSACLLEADGAVHRLGRVSKPVLARALLDKIETLCYGATRPTTGS